MNIGTNLSIKQIVKKDFKQSPRYPQPTKVFSECSSRLQELEKLFSGSDISFEELRNICFHGIPESSTLGWRSLCWKLLLNYLPLCKDAWEDSLKKSRNLYRQFIDEMIVTPGLSDSSSNSSGCDHPLSLNPDSEWQTYFKDNEVLQQIDKDVRRLCPDISFFQQPTEFPCLPVVQSQGVRRLHRRVQLTILDSANVERKGLGATKITLSRRKATEDYAPLEEGSEAHWEVVERILFLYAKLNPGQGYVQGMNELIGPIYYTFASDPDITWREQAEADCFFCFTNLMGETRDFFIKTLDESQSGIQSMMSKLSAELKDKDYDIWARLSEQHLLPEYYSFRWITLLLSQEFPLPDVLRIWDSLFSDRNRFNFLIHICCSMIMLIRNELLSSEFSANVKALQNYPSTDVQIILSKAALLAS